MSLSKSYTVALKIGHQNIHGNGKLKLEHNDLVDKILNHHIFGIQESWLNKDDACPDIKGYSIFRSERKKHIRGIRNSGGSIIYVKRQLLRGITKLSGRSNEHGDVIWLKLDKHFFGLEQNLLLCYAYIVPVAKKESFELLKSEIEQNSNKGVVSILGDSNCRIGNKSYKHFDVYVKDNETIIKELSVPNRQCQDKKVNGNGRKMIKFLQDYDLIPANGTVMGDLKGRYTCVSWNGVSCNDLFIFHRSLLPRINYFRVHDSFDWYSDHRAISLSIRVNVVHIRNTAKSWHSLCKRKMDWTSDNVSKYKSIISSTEYREKFETFSSSNFETANEAANKFSELLSEVLNKTFPRNKRRTSNLNKKNVKERRHDFSITIQNAKRRFKNAQRWFKKDKSNLNRRHTFIRERSRYKKIIYMEKRLAKEDRINKVAKLESLDPKSFWKELKEIISPKSDAVGMIDKDEWFNHFNRLLNVPNAEGQDTQFLDYVKTSLAHLEGISINNDIECLNKKVDVTDLSSSVKDLKMKKSVYIDNIGNEALKHGIDILTTPLITLYNIVLDKGEFPNLWGNGLVVPVFKKNDKLDVNNYRGIVISSCVGKLFLRIITKRLDDFMEGSGKWVKNQCGFKKDHRTDDNLFVLKTVFEKYVKKQKKKVFLAFIDFSKFFDKINRHLMLYKLIKYGVNGNIYRIIKSIYSNTEYSINIGGEVSPVFKASNGVKQGCCLSPALSNLFQNDLHEIFDTYCDPITIGNLIFNSISWADDLIMVSLSKEGLQKCLDKLSAYCSKWGLEVNVDKTKIMVFSNSYDKNVKFHYKGIELTQEKYMIYLGFNIAYNGNIKSVISDRVAKARKVGNMILHAIRTNKNISVSLAMSLFEKQVSPVLLYGCPIWSTPHHGRLMYIENQPEVGNTRSIMNDISLKLLGRKVSFEYAKRVGKKPSNSSQNTNRKILVKLEKYSDKLALLSKDQADFKLSNFETPCLSDLDKLHLSFCKKSLNMSKYASNTGVLFELGALPVEHKAFSLVIKYWLRLTGGTKNILLNEAYTESVEINSEWLQSVEAMLCENGFKNVWENPSQVDHNNFHKEFRSRLDDQFIQKVRGKINDSQRFDILKLIANEDGKFSRQSYLGKINNPHIREYFTRLRLDINILENSAPNKKESISNGVCRQCTSGSLETVEHFLLECDKYDHIRNDFIMKTENDYSCINIRSLPNDRVLTYILNLDCPDGHVSSCCKFINRIYNMRQDSTV